MFTTCVDCEVSDGLCAVTNTLQVVAEVESFGCNGARFVDGNEMALDAVIFATGYRSNVPSWLQVGNSLTKQNHDFHKRIS
jgi:lysine/ornithine N-monooxygenase